jgi:hypothetical protein
VGVPWRDRLELEIAIEAIDGKAMRRMGGLVGEICEQELRPEKDPMGRGHGKGSRSKANGCNYSKVPISTIPASRGMEAQRKWGARNIWALVQRIQKGSRWWLVVAGARVAYYACMCV